MVRPSQAAISVVLLLMALYLFSLGISGIKEICQTVDSGQVESTRWSETSSGVLKVRFFSLGPGETGDIVRQLCNKAVNW